MRFLGYWIKRIVRQLLRLKGSPHNIALGFCMGIMVGFSPTFGFQIIGVIVLNTLFRINKLSGLVSVQITNVATAIPIYMFTAWLGSLVMGVDFNSHVIESKLKLVMNLEYITDWSINWDAMKQSWDVMVFLGAPLWVGGILAGLLGSAVCYYPCVAAIERYRRMAQKRREDRAERIHTRLLRKNKKEASANVKG